MNTMYGVTVSEDQKYIRVETMCGIALIPLSTDVVLYDPDCKRMYVVTYDDGKYFVHDVEICEKGVVSFDNTKIHVLQMHHNPYTAWYKD